MSNTSIEMHEICTLSSDVAQDFVEQIKKSVLVEIFNKLSPANIMAFAYNYILQELFKDSELEPRTRAHLLKGVVTNMGSASELFRYDSVSTNWMISGSQVTRSNMTVNSEKLVEQIWQEQVIPSYNIMISASQALNSTVQVQSASERVKNFRNDEQPTPRKATP